MDDEPTVASVLRILDILDRQINDLHLPPDAREDISSTIADAHFLVEEFLCECPEEES